MVCEFAGDFPYRDPNNRPPARAYGPTSSCPLGGEVLVGLDEGSYRGLMKNSARVLATIALGNLY